ncbi:hypothetical protein OG21DRAFT_404860 [Imleria badia]|nr:hypothetical protein OG21DRAFT_404860 [Imleria badia]
MTKNILLPPGSFMVSSKKLQECLKRRALGVQATSRILVTRVTCHSFSVVLTLNPFFVLENDPTPDRGSQLPRTTTFIILLGLVHDLHIGLLESDSVHGPLDMDQYTRLLARVAVVGDTDSGILILVTFAELSYRLVCRSFGTVRIPTQVHISTIGKLHASPGHAY